MEYQLSENRLNKKTLGNSLAAMAEIYREGCMDMDHPRQDVQADALREETRKTAKAGPSSRMLKRWVKRVSFW